MQNKVQKVFELHIVTPKFLFFEIDEYDLN